MSVRAFKNSVLIEPTLLTLVASIMYTVNGKVSAVFIKNLLVKNTHNATVRIGIHLGVFPNASNLYEFDVPSDSPCSTLLIPIEQELSDQNSIFAFASVNAVLSLRATGTEEVCN